MIWSCNLSLALLCTLSLPSIAFLNISCLLLSICISQLMSWHLLSKPTKPFHCASHLAQLATQTSSSSCQNNSKIFCPCSRLACWEVPPIVLAVLPSGPSGLLLLLWLTTNFLVAVAFSESFGGTAGPLSFLLDTQYHATRLAHILAVHNFSFDSPAIVFCLPQSGSASLMCRRAGKYCCLFSLSAFRMFTWAQFSK